MTKGDRLIDRRATWHRVWSRAVSASPSLAISAHICACLCLCDNCDDSLGPSGTFVPRMFLCRLIDSTATQWLSSTHTHTHTTDCLGGRRDIRGTSSDIWILAE